MTSQYGADQVGHVKSELQSSQENISNPRIMSLELHVEKLSRILLDHEKRIRRLSVEVDMLSRNPA